MDLSGLNTAPFVRQVADTLSEYGMVTPGDHILVGLSGGPDSVSLLLALAALSKQLNITLGAAHINHLLRGDDAKKDEAFARNLAGQLNLAVHITQIDVHALAEKEKHSLEEAGRNARYGFFHHLCRKHAYTRVATGHTEDDNAEMLLINLLRGSGIQGLTGIPPVRDRLFIRPLIRTSKEQILRFLKETDQDFRIDASNTDTRFLRNRIRCRLIPLLEKEYNPSVVDTLNRFSRIAARENDYLTRTAEEALQNCMAACDADGLHLHIRPLLDLHPALQFRVLRLAIRRVKADLKRIQQVHLQDILDLARRKGPDKSLDLPGQIRIYKSGEVVRIRKEDTPLRQIGRQAKACRSREQRNRSKGD